MVTDTRDADRKNGLGSVSGPENYHTAFDC